MNNSKKRKVNNGHCVTKNQQRLNRRTIKASSSASSSSCSNAPSMQACMNTSPYVIMNSAKADNSGAKKHSQQIGLNTTNNLDRISKPRVCQIVKQRRSAKSDESANRPKRLNNRSSNQSSKKPRTSQNNLQILAAVASSVSFIDRSHLMSLSQDSLSCIDDNDVKNDQYPNDVEFQTASNYCNDCKFGLNSGAAEIESRSRSESESLENCSDNVISTVFDEIGCYEDDVYDNISETGLDKDMNYSKTEKPVNKVQYNNVSEANLDGIHRRRKVKVHPYYKIAFHSLLTPTSG